jgi:hypothetical protein
MVTQLQTSSPPSLHDEAEATPRLSVNSPVSSLAAFDCLYVQSPKRWLVLLLLVYLVAGSMFAYYTPPWQAPDEPAHYNYVAYIAKTVTLPMLQMGDYNQETLNNLLATKFVLKLSPGHLRYESYQPPLYYLLATPIFWLSHGSLLALRLFGVLLGALTVLLLYLCLALVFPGKVLIPLGAAAFSALLPMHMAMAASVNNDGLAELLLMATMLMLLQWMRHRFYASDEARSQSMEFVAGGKSWRRPQSYQLLWIGILFGLGMLTKIYAYLMLPLALAVVVVVTWLSPRAPATLRESVLLSPSRTSAITGLRRALWVAVPAALLALPTWIRNVVLYGGWDLLGMAWHDQVVVGQPRTDAWIADVGWIAYGERAFSFTFQSFWGVFGWMSVFMDERIYTALLVFTGVIFLGVLWATVRFISGVPDTDMDVFQLSVLILFGLMLVVVTVGYIGYNFKFVQHQGRYFFWGLLPISTVVALGWREVLQPLQGAITGFMAAVLAAANAVSGMVTGYMNKWTLLAIGLIAFILFFQPLLLGGVGPDTLRWLPNPVRQWMARPRVAWLLRQMRGLVWALPFILLFILDLAIPQWFIVPLLS